MSNTIVIIGTLGRDPEAINTSSGTMVAKVSIADNYYSRGEKKTNWWSCKFFGKGAEFVQKNLRKGATISVTARIEQFRTDDGKDLISVVVSGKPEIIKWPVSDPGVSDSDKMSDYNKKISDMKANEADDDDDDGLPF